MNLQIFLSERPNCTCEKHHSVANLQAVYKLNAFFLASIDKFSLLYTFQALHRYIISTGQIYHFFFAESLIFSIHKYFILPNVTRIQHCDITRSTRTAGSKVDTSLPLKHHDPNNQRSQISFGYSQRNALLRYKYNSRKDEEFVTLLYML